MLGRKHIKYSLIFIISLFISIGLYNFSLPKVQAATTQTYHPSIKINGNEELDIFCNNSAMSGNSTHPYIIQDIEITFDGVQYGVEITNVTKYLLIKNVNVTKYFQSTQSTGIYLENCKHITIDDSHYYNNSYGMVFKNVSESRIEDTSGSINQIRGIVLENCHNNTFYNFVAFENGLENNQGNGMDMFSSNYNIIEYSIFLENWGYGLYMEDSLYNEVFDSDFLYNHEECYIIYGDPDETNNFYDNNCRNRLIPGAPIWIIGLVSVSTVIILILVTKKIRKRS